MVPSAPGCLLLAAACLVVLPERIGAQETGSPRPGKLFDNVVKTLKRRYWDKEFRKEKLPAIAEKFRAAAEAAESLDEECAVVHGFLSHVPSSHLALYSEKSYKHMMAELFGRKQRMLGMQLKQQGSRYFACKIFEGGPADRAGIRRGDRVVSIDGASPHESERLGRRTDDAHLDDAPLHPILVDPKEDEEVRFVVERRPGMRRTIVVKTERFSAVTAARNSAQVVEHAGMKLGYVHFWYIHSGCVKLLNELLEDDFADCDSMILDLRGRGGNAMEAQGIVRFFTGKRRKWDRPFVVLMDKESRSAKEMLAYEFKTRKAAPIIGEKSAGAMVPAQFRSVGQGMTLMYPGFRLRKYSEKVELVGVDPDVEVAYPLRYTAGADPILREGIRYLTTKGRRPNDGRSPAASKR